MKGEAQPVRYDAGVPLYWGDRVGRYVVLEPLGEGGMGEVYRARDEALGREVALKVLHADGDGSARRIAREARAAAELAHPNVVTVHDVGEATDDAGRATAYLAMELVKGRPLRAFVGDASVPIERRVAWLLGVARALAAAHARGIVHRDVKPENVMVRDDGVPKVVDFGIAKRAAPLLSPSDPTPLATATDTGATMGTPLYMSPEQMRGEAVDGRCDQFAWGLVAYELLSGEHPWRGHTTIGATVSILSRDPPPLRARAPGVLPRWEAAIARALAKTREARFASMGDLIEAMQGARPARPRPARRAVGIALGFAAAAGAVASAVAGVRAVARSGTGASSVVADVASAPSAGCATNAECVRAHHGDPFVCRAGACAPLASAACEVHASPADVAADDTVWLGAMLPLSDPDRAWVRADAQALELARQDFATTAGTLAARAAAVHAPPIALLVCDDTRDADEVARHLVDDVRVPAVMGFGKGDEALRLIATTFVPRRVLTIDTLNQQGYLADVPLPANEPRLLWRTTLDLADAAAPIARFVHDELEPRARAVPDGPGRRGAMRVAFVRQKGGAVDFARAFFDRLAFNGASALANGGAYREVTWDVRPGEPPEHARAAAAEELASFAPHVVVFQGIDDVVRDVIAPAERRWPRASRPFYVTMGVFPQAAFDYVGASAERRRRFFGLTNVSTAVNARFVVHYNETFAEPTTRTTSPSNSYDAFYLLADAAYAVGDEAITGPSLARAIDRLRPPGTPIDVGPSGILAAFNVLRAGGRVDLAGALGPLDLDPARGEAPVPYAILCVGADERGVAREAIESGLVYRADGRAQGALRCLN